MRLDKLPNDFRSNAATPILLRYRGIRNCRPTAVIERVSDLQKLSVALVERANPHSASNRDLSDLYTDSTAKRGLRQAQKRPDSGFFRFYREENPGMFQRTTTAAIGIVWTVTPLYRSAGQFPGIGAEDMIRDDLCDTYGMARVCDVCWYRGTQDVGGFGQGIPCKSRPFCRESSSRK